MTDVRREALGIRVKAAAVQATAPATRPVGIVDVSQRLRHTIGFADEGTPTVKAKPAGVGGCEIWYKIGQAPTDASELSFAGTATRTPFVMEFVGDNAGKSVHYWLRWISTRGEAGPWSQAVSGTVAG